MNCSFSGYSWSEWEDWYVDSRLDSNTYDSRDIALKACAEKKGKCKGVVETDKNKYYLIGGKGTKTKKSGYSFFEIGGMGISIIERLISLPFNDLPHNDQNIPSLYPYS